MSAQEIDEQIRRETVSQCYTAFTRQGGNVYPESETEQALRAEIAALKAQLALARESRKRLVGLIHTARAANRKVAMDMVMRANALGIENCSLRARLAKLVDRWSHMVPMNKYSDEQVAYYDGLHDCADELDIALKGAK